MISNLVIEGNPALVEIILSYGEFQLHQALGSSWKQMLPDNVRTNVEKLRTTDSCTGAVVVSDLLHEGKVSSIEQILYIHTIEVPSHFQRKGHGLRAIKFVEEDYARKNGFEYMLCEAVTAEGRSLVDRAGYTQLLENYYGKLVMADTRP